MMLLTHLKSSRFSFSARGGVADWKHYPSTNESLHSTTVVFILYREGHPVSVRVNNYAVPRRGEKESTRGAWSLLCVRFKQVVTCRTYPSLGEDMEVARKVIVLT